MSDIEQRASTGEIDSETPTGGIYDLPIVGQPFKKARRFYNDMEPTAEDSFGVAAGKQALRYGTVAAAGVAATAVAAVIAL